MAYKIASKKQQARLRRPVGELLGSYDDVTPQEMRENLNTKKRALEEQLRYLPKSDPIRKEIGQEVVRLNKEIYELKLRFNSPRNFSNYLCDIIKKEVTIAQWKIWVQKARLLCEQETEKEVIMDLKDEQA